MISGLIQKQALILPPGAVGLQLGGEPIVAQHPNGTVIVAATSSPVLVRTNFGDARVWGAEQTLTVRLTRHWSLRGLFTYVRTEERVTGAPPNVPGSTPPSDGWIHVRYDSGGRFWIEPYLHAVDRQNRLSTLALRHRRIGAARSFESIAQFFRHGASVRGLIGPGEDGHWGTADDVLRPTGETLPEVQTRVLGPSGSEAPLFRAIPGHVIVNLRGGVRLTESQHLLIDMENLTDRNYRGVGWAMDGPGRSVFLRYQFRF